VAESDRNEPRHPDAAERVPLPHHPVYTVSRAAGRMGELLVQKTRTAWILTLRGEHDLSTRPTLDAEIEAGFAHGTKMIIDLTEASFIDSSIIASLINAQEQAATDAKDGFVVVSPENSFALRLLRLVGYERRLAVYATVEKAMTAIAFAQTAGRHARLIEEIVTAFERRDAPRLAKRIHPEAIIEPRPSPKPLHGPHEVAGYINTMRQRRAEVTISSAQEIAPDAVLIEGREQWQADDNSLLDTPVVWVVRFRDSLIWRTRTYTNREEALNREA
jgi:anti-anti-sigma factor